jgi:hypothetical protein
VQLPFGYATKYTNSPPTTGAALVGWVVAAYFPAAGEWFDGLVVCQLPTRGSRWYPVFHETEDFHEAWEFPLIPRCTFGLRRQGITRSECSPPCSHQCSEYGSQ